MDRESILKENHRRVVAYFQTGAKPNGRRALGVEVEHLVLADDGDPISYLPTDVHVGVRDVLGHLSTWYPERTLNGNGDLLGLLGEEGSITLEPAAQLELSAAPYEQLADIESAYHNFHERAESFLESNGAHLEARGYHPTRRAQDLTLIPKRRYDFMDAYFSHIRSDGARMMRASASTQVSVDYSDEQDAVRKIRVASALAPILSAIADNTPIFEGTENHVPIRRLQLWREVDELRCGTIPNVFTEGFGFASYANWLLSTPPIFVTRAAAHDPDGEKLRPFFDESAFSAYADGPLRTADIEHLISMFWPDVRLKRFVEIRPADSLPLPLAMGYTALIKGLFYSEESLGAIEAAFGVDAASSASRAGWPLTTDDVDNAIAQVQARGLDGVLYGKTLREWERRLFSLARAALDDAESDYLAPLEGFAAQKPWWQV